MVREGSAAIDSALRSLAVEGVVMGCRLISRTDLTLLHPEEIEVTRYAVAKRQMEFATGRALLRELMGSDVAIPPLPSRAPRLPVGVIGSLAHDDSYAIAAITRDRTITSLGIDIEPATALPDELKGAILRGDEQCIDAHLAFTLKEATYKAWSSLGGGLLDHHDVRLEIENLSFRAEVLKTHTWFFGRFSEVDGRTLALVVVKGVTPATADAG